MTCPRSYQHPLNQTNISTMKTQSSILILILRHTPSVSDLCPSSINIRILLVVSPTPTHIFNQSSRNKVMWCFAVNQNKQRQLTYFSYKFKSSRRLFLQLEGQANLGRCTHHLCLPLLPHIHFLKQVLLVAFHLDFITHQYNLELFHEAYKFVHMVVWSTAFKIQTSLSLIQQVLIG